jgi:epoxyqueuosine reductase QueG
MGIKYLSYTRYPITGAEITMDELAKRIEEAVREVVANNTKNRLTHFNNQPIFDEPLVGFADGDDPIFTLYKTVVGDFHLTPREALEKYIEASAPAAGKPQKVSVVAWILPFTKMVKESLRRETEVPSLEWNHARWEGQELMDQLAKFIVAILRGMGYTACAPDMEPFFAVKADGPYGRSANWSQRHIAYAAGLGTFSLNDGLITAKGIAMRCGSIVTSAAITPTPRAYTDRRGHCLFFRDGSCRRCAERCPAGAISEAGHDKVKCRDYVVTGQLEALKRLGREEGYMGRYLACGLCQTKVPCESGIPPAKADKSN